MGLQKLTVFKLTDGRHIEDEHEAAREQNILDIEDFCDEVFTDRGITEGQILRDNADRFIDMLSKYKTLNS